MCSPSCPIATLLFTGADRWRATDTPAFGWNINQEFSRAAQPVRRARLVHLLHLWRTRRNPGSPSKQGRTKVGILAYNVSQSSDCADGVKAAFEKWPSGQASSSRTTR